MSSGRFAEVRTPIILSILMVLMTQVGYLDLMNAWSGDEETLMDAETLFETGGQGSANYSLAQSTEGEAVALNAAMDTITFGYAEDADAAPIYGNGSIWTVSSSSVLSLISPQRTTTANNSMFSDDVFFFASGVCALSMHNISNGTTWEEFDVSGCTSQSQFYRSFFLLGQTFIFEIYDGTDKGQIWAHNVSNATTWRVGGGTFSNGAVTTHSALFQYGNDVWFYSTRQLYRINGSTFDVEQRSDFSGGSSNYHYGWASSNGSIYFVGKPESDGLELYRHDVTSNQSYRITDLNPSGDGVYSIRSVSDDLLWIRGRNSSSTGTSLWVHNTTLNQTYQLSTISPSLSDAVLVNDVMYFYASTTGDGSEPHAYSLANNSTWLLKDIYPGSTGSSVPTSNPTRWTTRLQAHNGLLYMLRNGGASQGDEEVWVYDPSTTETYRVSDISGSNEVVNIMGAAGDTVYFTTEKIGYCCYMYAHSSTSNSTFELTNFPDGRDYKTGGNFFLPLNGTVYMNGDYQPSGLVAWSPDVLTTKATPVSGATCTVSPTLPAGLSLNQGNCTVSGTPTAITSQTSYTLTATINGQTYGATFWLITDYLPLTPSVADLDATVGAPIEPITFGIPTGAKAGDGGHDAPYRGTTMLGGDFHSCAVLADSSMACWGDNQYGQLGDGTTTSRSTPVPVNLPAGSAVASIPAYAADHSCAVLDNGSVYCWGLGSAFSTGSSVSTPQHLPLPAGRTPVSIEADHHSTCVILDNGSMMCVGNNQYNRLGYNGSATGTFSYVEYLPQGAIVVDMSLGQHTACALLDDGDVWCWGSNNYAVQQNIPSGNISAIEGHVDGHCALYDNGSVACWGSNSFGQRGIGNFSSANGVHFTEPMPGNLSVTSLATGDNTVCALLSNGSVACWGESYANGYASDTHTPTLIPWPHGSMQATAVSVGWYHGCALLENGSMWCWGQNSYGQLGDGTTTDAVSGTFVDLDQAVRGPPGSMSGATCSVNPALPAGLSLAQGTCTISGTPTGTSPTTTYTV
ncbi:MAG: putative Ig domain-containing protein, partial [Candidatus Poseidonia sp.]|nr:putative Ig domain-containing protein [Poseidonia sp.]